jgi:predicted nucleic acid-binding protein
MDFMSALEPRQFIDTNVLIYAHDISAGAKHGRAMALLKELWQERTGCLSTQVLQEFYVNVTRKIAKPLSPALASQIIADLAEWEVHRPGVNDILEAINLQSSHQISFWDAMILMSAQQLGCETVWSEDLNAGEDYEGAVVRNPFV